MKTIHTTATGQRVKLFDMVGTFEGTKLVPITAKNYCDGSSTIHLRDVEVGLIRWDENKAELCTISNADFRHVEFA